MNELKQKIQLQFGKEIRYPKDCEALAVHINSKAGETVSVSTLHRIFGFIEGTKKPRLYTLDVLAKYLGYSNWHTLNAQLSIDNDASDSAYLELENINVKELKKSTIILINYNPNRELLLKYIGDFKFKIIKSIKSSLVVNDTVTIFNIVKSYPLIVDQVTRSGKELGKYIAAKHEGIVNIRIIEET
jgi:hypothetical protein